ncbi:MAG TPA: tetratricopeptide repeat protein, partial [Isosphaeraceae bacterium]|nr:tetratricopeptide repeat protein [Isosphaeraceae bacterium]
LQRAWEAGYHGSTVVLARRFLARYPDFGPVWGILADALIGLARYEEAEKAVSKALELPPRHNASRRILFSFLGHLHKKRGDYDRAAEWYRRAIDADPEESTGYVYLGAVLAEQGRFVEAEETFRSATQCLYGCISETYYNLGVVLRNQERFREAADCFRDAILRDRDYRLAKKALRDVELCIHQDA